MSATAELRPAYFEGMGEHVSGFMQSYIIQSKGRWAGNPIVLEKWQHEVLNELFMVREWSDGRREMVYREALIGIARKNGKSTLASGIAIYMLLAAGENAPEVYAAAASGDQARIIFDQARKYVEASPVLRDWLKPYRNVIECKSNGGVFKVLSSDGPLQHGLNPSGVLIDELWAHKNPELYYALTTGSGARENPLAISITTAGFDRNTLLFQNWEMAKALEARGIDAMREARFYFRWFCAPPDAHIDDRAGWRAANPSSWIDDEELQRERDRLPDSVFRRLHLNQWTETEDAWIKPHEWDACAGKPTFNPRLPTWFGLDVGIKRDSAALVWAQWGADDKLNVGQWIMRPEDEAEGFGVADVRGRVGTTAGKWPGLKEVAFDPWSFRESAELLAERGVPMVEFPQNATRMAPASEQLYELVIEKRLVHDGDPGLRAHVLSGVVSPTDRGGWRISKRKSREQIDGLIALAMAADRAVTMKNARPPRRGVTFY